MTFSTAFFLTENHCILIESSLELIFVQAMQYPKTIYDDLGPIPETIRSRSAQIRSCDPDRPIAFHKRRSRSAHQIEKLRNQAVYCQWNHDINHSPWNLELISSDRDWMKNVRLMISIHDVQWQVWRRHFCVSIPRAPRPVQCTRTVLFTIERGLNMPCLTGMLMWLTSLKIYKLLTQDRPFSSKCISVVCGFLTMVILQIKWPFVVMKFLIQHRST